MKDWEYSFKPTTRVDWFQQIEKDLKSTSMESLHREWWPGEPIIPFHHKEDHDFFVALPDHFFTHHPKIMEWVSLSTDPDEINKKVLSALTFGAQSIVFEGKSSFPFDFQKILADVHHDMIEIAFQSPNHDIQTTGEHDAIKQRILRDDRPSEVFFESLSGSQNFYVVYKIPMTGLWIEEVAHVWKKLREDFALWQSGKISIKNFPHKCILQINPESDFIKQIIQTRVLQLLWLNEINHYVVNISRYSPIEVHLAPQGQTDPDQYLLRVSEMALAASLTGAGTICIHHIDDPGITDHYRRNNRNVHHLLQLESQMYKGRDPMAGSYAIDYYSKKWTGDILSKLE